MPSYFGKASNSSEADKGDTFGVCLLARFARNFAQSVSARTLSAARRLADGFYSTEAVQESVRQNQPAGASPRFNDGATTNNRTLARAG